MFSNQSPKEKDLLLRLEQDDQSAFDALYQYYEPRLRLYLYPFAGSDANMMNIVLQDVFVKLWLKRKDMVGIAFLEYYLQRMAKNRLFDILKLRNIQDRHEKIYAHLRPDADNATRDQLQLKEYLAIAREGIERLPERRRVIFSMNMLEGLTLDEIAGELQVSREVVKKQLQKARSFLKEYIAKNGDLPLTIGWAMLLLAIS